MESLAIPTNVPTEGPNLTVEDAVTQIEIEHKDQDKVQSDGNDTEETNATMANNDSTDTLDTPNLLIDEHKGVDEDQFHFKDDHVSSPHDDPNLHSDPHEHPLPLNAEAKMTETTSTDFHNDSMDVSMTDSVPSAPLSQDVLQSDSTMNPMNGIDALQHSVQRMEVDVDGDAALSNDHSNHSDPNHSTNPSNQMNGDVPDSIGNMEIEPISHQQMALAPSIPSHESNDNVSLSQHIEDAPNEHINDNVGDKEQEDGNDDDDDSMKNAMENGMEITRESTENSMENSQNTENTENVVTNDVDSDDNFDPNAPCGVCWAATSYDDDALVYCDGCNVPLHQSCYMISEGTLYGKSVCNLWLSLSIVTDNML